jgi:hypothetical protein
MLCRALLTSLFLLATAAASSFAQTAPTPPASTSPASPASAVETPAPDTMDGTQVGDHWTYENKDEVTGEVKSTLTQTVTDVSGSDVAMRVDFQGSSNSNYLTFDSSWNLKESGDVRYDPNDGTGVRLPLAVGKSWSFKATSVNAARGFSAKFSGTSKILAQETVTTPAGTFETFKIETSTQFHSANNPTKKVLVMQQMWYAPSINHWVKRSFVSQEGGHVRNNSIIALMDYGRR